MLLLGVNTSQPPASVGSGSQDAGDADELFAGLSVNEEDAAPSSPAPGATSASADLLGSFFQEHQPPAAARQTAQQPAKPSQTPKQQPLLQQQQAPQAKQPEDDSLLSFQDHPTTTNNQSFSLLDLITQPSSSQQARPAQQTSLPQAPVRTQPAPTSLNDLDLLLSNDDLLSGPSASGTASLHPLTAPSKSADPFSALVSDTIPQGKVDLKKVPMNNLPRPSASTSTPPIGSAGFSSPFFPTSPGLLNSTSNSSIIAPVTRQGSEGSASKPAFSFMDSGKKDAFGFVQDEIRKK